MNDLIKQVTPLTLGIIWFVKDESDLSNPHYREIDYLLDGLLTANLKVSKIDSSKVIVGQNFNKSLYVLILKEAKASEIQSYVSLFKKDLTAETDILVIDEWKGLPDLKKDFKDISPNLRLLS
jgi:hypothetical protein